ncbi:hypothetical protein [Streptomyces flaveolus]|uniref:hypothetical protein n=1 Tax=Streptomyces flaveolus TaxID=67297 RepID=UPI00340E7B94
MPKKQSTAVKKARTTQRASGGKYTEVLDVQTCGETLNPFGELPETCARTPHSTWEDSSEDGYSRRDAKWSSWSARPAPSSSDSVACTSSKATTPR